MFLSLITLLVAAEPMASEHVYAAADGNLTLSDPEIAARIIAAPRAQHLIWMDGWDRWKAWWEIPELTRLTLSIAEDTVVQWAPAGQERSSKTAKEVAAALKSGQHGLAWKEGMSGWVDAATLPEVAFVLAWPGVASGSRIKAPPLPTSTAPRAPSALPSLSAAPPVAPPPEAPPETPPTLRPASALPSVQATTTPAPAAPPIVPPVFIDPMPPLQGPLHPGPLSQFSGELRLDFFSNNLQDFVGGSDRAIPQFLISAARLNMKSDVGPHLQIIAESDLALHPGMEAPLAPPPAASGGSFPERINGYAEEELEAGWSFGARELYAIADVGKAKTQTLSAGLQYSRFAMTDRYEEDFHFGGLSYDNVLTVAGLVPERDLSAAWNYTGDHWGADIQVGNGTGGLEDNFGKSFTLRASARPNEVLHLDLSGFMDFGGADSAEQSVMGALDASFETERLRGAVLLSGGNTSEGDRSFSYAALQADLMASLPLHGKLSAFNIGARGMAWLGPLVTAEQWPDNWYRVGSSLSLDWKTRASTGINTGLVYEVSIPENIDATVAHSLALSAALRF